MPRKFVIGDIRGDITNLRNMIQKIAPVDGDVLIFTGSYLGPGSSSRAVMDYLIALQVQKPNVVFNFLKGCYEYVFENIVGDYHKDRDPFFRMWKEMDGPTVLESYAVGVPQETRFEKLGKILSVKIPFHIPSAHIEFIEKHMFLWYEDNDYPYVVFHAGPDIHKPKDPDVGAVIIGINKWWETDWLRWPEKTIIFSHVPFKKPFFRNGKMGIDLGAGMGGKLCAFEMRQDKFYIEG